MRRRANPDSVLHSDMCAKSVDGVKTCRCKLSAVNTADETATAVFLNGEERAVFFSDLKAPKTLHCS